VKAQTKNPKDDVDSLLALIETLRAKCPWDRKQTPETLIVYLIEEVYELLDAVTSGDMDHILEESGDVLFQIMFLIFLYHEKKRFSLSEVIEKNIEKMTRRHPHVFGDNDADTAEKVIENWEIIKSAEKGKSKSSLLDSVPAGLPSLHRAHMLSEKVGKAGFDWNDIGGVSEKVEEEWKELKDAIESGNRDHVSM
jgi:tetrapyrrole methylase family protein/MazG family protein